MYEIPATNFTASLARSLSHTDDYRAMLAEVFGVPLANVVKTDEEDDRLGFDFYVTYRDGRVRSVDVKHASAKAAKWWHSDAEPSICLEVEANVERDIPGALFSGKPMADFTVNVFESLPERVVVIPSERLRGVAQQYRQAWEALYGLRHTRTKTTFGSYTSTFLAVPLLDLLIGMHTPNVLTVRGQYVCNLIP